VHHCRPGVDRDETLGWDRRIRVGERGKSDSWALPAAVELQVSFLTIREFLVASRVWLDRNLFPDPPHPGSRGAVR
jgi:hypothetical protein